MKKSRPNQKQTLWIRINFRKHSNYAKYDFSPKFDICEKEFTISYSIKQKAKKSIFVKSIHD